MIRVRRRVRKPRVQDDQLGAVRLAVDDALRVRIEVVAGLEVGADQQNDFRVRVIRAGPIEPHPKLVTFARSRRADVGVRVVTVNAPGRQNAFRESIFAGPSDVIHDLLAAIFDDRFANS